MAEIPRIGVEEARGRVGAGEALLICAYADEAKCHRIRLEGSITLGDLQSRMASLNEDQELIFYCA